MSVEIKYKGNTIASANTNTTKTIKTSGKYCEADIEVINTPDGGGTPVINPLSVTANGTYNAPSGVDGYSPVTVNVPQGIPPTGNINITDTNVTDVTNYATAQVVDADLIASNIKKDVNILGVVGTFEGGGTVKTTQITLTEELNSYGILQAMGAKFKYKHSYAALYIFSDAAATTGGDYTNNNYRMFHNATTIVSAKLNQTGGHVPPSNGVFVNNWNTYDSEGRFINADGSFSFRRQNATVLAPIGARCLLVEVPYDNDLTLWGE